jgi:hypothetical protein
VERDARSRCDILTMIDRSFLINWLKVETCLTCKILVRRLACMYVGLYFVVIHRREKYFYRPSIFSTDMLYIGHLYHPEVRWFGARAEDVMEVLHSTSVYERNGQRA